MNTKKEIITEIVMYDELNNTKNVDELIQMKADASKSAGIKIAKLNQLAFKAAANGQEKRGAFLRNLAKVAKAQALAQDASFQSLILLLSNAKTAENK